MRSLKRLNQIAQAIYDKKGMNIIALDVRKISSLTDYFIIAEGNVERHVTAIAQSLIEQQKDLGHNHFHMEGLSKGDWVVIDFGEVIVHLFHPELREKYNLEKLWRNGHIIDLKIETQNREFNE